MKRTIKAGVWGSGLDTTLMAIRGAINEHGAKAFPVDAIENVMDPTGRTLVFREAEIQVLANLPYRDPRTFAVLSLLFPHTDLRNKFHIDFHIDHVFPKSRFTLTKLSGSGLRLRVQPPAYRELDRLEAKAIDFYCSLERQACSRV